MHLACDGLGQPIRFILSAGQRHDITGAEALRVGFAVTRVIADKGYDADALIAAIQESGAEAVIPSKANRKEQREIDRHYYKERHLIECFIGKLKHYRRVFARFDKLAKNYLNFVYFASVLIWLR